MSKRDVVPPIRDDDPLGRGVFSSKDKKRVAKKRAPYKLFLPKDPPEKISVSRLEHASDDVMAKIGDHDGKDRGQTFYGWAKMPAKAARSMERQVRATPTSRNRWHADIVLPDDAKEDERVREKHAFDLARNAVWHPRPDDSIASSYSD